MLPFCRYMVDVNPGWQCANQEATSGSLKYDRKLTHFPQLHQRLTVPWYGPSQEILLVMVWACSCQRLSNWLAFVYPFVCTTRIASQTRLVRRFSDRNLRRNICFKNISTMDEKLQSFRENGTQCCLFLYYSTPGKVQMDYENWRQVERNLTTDGRGVDFPSSNVLLPPAFNRENLRSVI